MKRDDKGSEGRKKGEREKEKIKEWNGIEVGGGNTLGALKSVNEEKGEIIE